MHKFIRFSHFPKNFLILFPLLLSNKTLDIYNFKIAFSSLLLFFFLTSSCYIINDYTDRNADKLNKLKEEKKINKKQDLIILLLLFSFFLVSISYFDQTEIISIYLYIINFLIYNFLAKKIKFFDIVFLTNFYLLRLFYGFEIFQLELSIGFIVFCCTFFLAFSILKRLIQIKVNKLKKNNKILAYNLHDCIILERLLFISLSLNIIIFFLFLTYNLKIFNLTLIVFAYNYSLIQLFFIFAAYLIFIFRIIKAYKDAIIKKDIYKFVVEDKFSYLILTIILFTIIL